METIDEDLLTSERPEELSNKQVFFEIWTRPRKVFRFLHAYAYDKYTIPLILAVSFLAGFDQQVSIITISGDISAWQVFTVILTVFLGWLLYYVLAALLSMVGKWLGGKARTKELLRVVAYSVIPALVRTPFSIIALVVGLLSHSASVSSIVSQGTLVITSIIGFILGMWQLVLMVVGISEVQAFSVGKAILSVILVFAIVFIPLMAIVFFVLQQRFF